MNPYFIRTVVRQDGERLPVLCDRDSGIPLFYPSCFAITQLRNPGLASNTMEQSLRAVMAFHMVLRVHAIDIFDRLNDGLLLEQWEVEALIRDAQIPLKKLAFIFDELVPPSPNVVQLDAARAAFALADIGRSSRSVRFVYIRRYLDWLADLWVGYLRKAGKSDLVKNLLAVKKKVSAQLSARIPRRGKRATLNMREGLSKAAKARLLEVIDVNSSDNPWKTKHTRARNFLCVKLLLKLGCRRGELLGLRVKDINFATGMLTIVRKADDKEDPRPQQPGTKTNDRELKLGDELTLLLKQYVEHRRSIKGARKHGFLLVANGKGAPLSLDGLTKVFKALRDGCPDLPQDLSPHVLRHTWNDDFSEHCDREGIEHEEEMRLRNYAMGWTPDSESAQFYLRRHTRETANKTTMKMQNDLLNKGTP